MYSLYYLSRCVKILSFYLGKNFIRLSGYKYYIYIRKRVDLNHQVLNTIFSKYLALPIATFPFYLQLYNLYSNNCNHRIKVNSRIKVKCIMGVNYSIRVKFIIDVTCKI